MRSTCFDQCGLSLLSYGLEFSAHAYFFIRNSNLKSVSTKNQHEILIIFGKWSINNILAVSKSRDLQFATEDIHFTINV